MKCPACGTNNFQGADNCESCQADLMALDGLSAPRTEISRSLMEDPIRKLNPKKPITITPQTTLAQGIQKMREAKIGCLLVVEKGEIQGILTERDILCKMFLQKKGSEPVQGVMTPAPEILSEDDSIAFALNKMSVGGFRHIPIVRNHQAMGIVSVRDILRYISDHLAGG